MNKYKLLILILLLLLVSLGGLFAAQRFAKPQTQKEVMERAYSMDISHSEEKPPFWEMTIPYLRERSYESSLGELSQVSQNKSYTTYLTHYLSDGLRVNGLLTIPLGKMPEGGWPAVIFIHGYIPPSGYTTQERYEDYVNYIAKNGFVVFKIDLRGHGESEGEAGGAYYSSDYIVDTLNARAALAKSDFVNGGKIGLWGHSMAGNIIIRSLAARPDIPAAVVWAGAVYTYEDFQSLGINDNSYRRPADDNSPGRQRVRELFDTHGEFRMESEFWKQVTPVDYLKDYSGAIAIHHAADDDVVNIGYSRNLVKLLEQYGIKHEFFEYQSGGHNINGASFSVAIERTVDFYKKYLQ